VKELIEEKVEEAKQETSFQRAVGGGGGNTGGNGYYRPPGGGNGNSVIWPDDPSRRRAATFKGIFTVSSSPNADSAEPVLYADVTDGCRYGDSDEDDCNRDEWWVRFTAKDNDAGLNTVDVMPMGRGVSQYGDSLYYRYVNGGGEEGN